jgi:sialic acid synthase SpsE
MTPPRATIIAEIGENHVGDWDRARQMVKEAARAGADVVKFQSYRGRDISDQDPEKKWFHQVELPDAMHFELAALAQENGVEFLSAPFTLERARFLCEEVGLRSIKIASPEMLNRPLLEYVAGRAQRVYLSTGMAELEEIREAANLLRKVPQVVILHCVTQYPLRDSDANLRAIQVLREAFPNHAIGYSDHTIGALAPVIAVALGATVIEKHFTLDKRLPGTDHVLSVTPEELRELVGMIRQAERLLGTALKKPVEAELAIREMVRNRFPKTAARETP